MLRSLRRAQELRPALRWSWIDASLMIQMVDEEQDIDWKADREKKMQTIPRVGNLNRPDGLQGSFMAAFSLWASDSTCHLSSVHLCLIRGLEWYCDGLYQCFRHRLVPRSQTLAWPRKLRSWRNRRRYRNGVQVAISGRRLSDSAGKRRLRV